MTGDSSQSWHGRSAAGGTRAAWRSWEPRRALPGSRRTGGGWSQKGHRESRLRQLGRLVASTNMESPGRGAGWVGSQLSLIWTFRIEGPGIQVERPGRSWIRGSGTQESVGSDLVGGILSVDGSFHRGSNGLSWGWGPRSRGDGRAAVWGRADVGT